MVNRVSVATITKEISSNVPVLKKKKLFILSQFIDVVTKGNERINTRNPINSVHKRLEVTMINDC